jgi:2,4-dienoyl-CoA reductase-like NADH-dependent reductase (Old Yellow Enzyme family)
MTPEYRHLFYSLRVGGLALKNRIFSSGHAEAMAEEPGTLTKAIWWPQEAATAWSAIELHGFLPRAA